MLSYSDVGLIIFQLAKPCRSEKNVQMGIWYFSNIDVVTYLVVMSVDSSAAGNIKPLQLK